MNKQRILTWAVGGLLLINFGLAALLMGGKPMLSPHDGRERVGPRNLISKRLDFMPDQLARYDQLIKQHQAEIIRLDADIRKAKNNLYRTLATDDPSQRDLLIGQLGTLQRQIETVHYNHFLDLKKLCMPSQQAKFRALTGDLAGYFAPTRKPSGRP